MVSEPININGWADIAENLAFGYGYKMHPEGELTALRVPIYPLFLAGIYKVFGLNRFTGLVFQCLIDVATGLVLYLLTLRLLGNAKAGIVSLVLFSLYLPGIFLTTRLQPEPLFSFLAVAMILIILESSQKESMKGLFLGGIMVGAATLCRPSTLLFPWTIPIFLWFYLGKKVHKVVKFSLVILLGYVLALSPWILRNYVLFHKFIPTQTNAGYNFFIGNYPPTLGTYSVQTEELPSWLAAKL
ncbi:MAG: glycosyltransferase family 39 protein, partial [Candidatus Hodarchaeota archaeon]